MGDETILVPFGPTREVPKGHRWCNACDGSGIDYTEKDEGEECEVCKGKGHWNADDIREYHERHPRVCQQACGEHHREPLFEE